MKLTSEIDGSIIELSKLTVDAGKLPNEIIQNTTFLIFNTYQHSNTGKFNVDYRIKQHNP